jgi:hypothetical protein
VVAIRVVVAVVLGVVTTVAVAWGSAAWVDLKDGILGYQGAPEVPPGVRFDIAELKTRTATRRGYTCCDMEPAHGFDGAAIKLFEKHYRSSQGAIRTDARHVAVDMSPVWGCTTADMLAQRTVQGGREYWLGDARGWPRRAFWCEMTMPAGSLCVSGVAGAIALLYPAGGDVLTFRALPYRPIWSGIVIDSALFGAAWSVLLLFRPTRARLRTRRGHCPRCNYSLAASGGAAAGCPECGWGR